MSGDEQGDPMVVVLEPAILDLVERFKPRGLPIFPTDVKTKVHRGVSQFWATPKAKRFNDQLGGGWLIDLSEQFNDEMLYAVVRSGPGGTRAVVKVVEADDVENFTRKGAPLPHFDGAEEAAEMEAAQARPAKGAAPSRAPAQPAAPAALDPNAPALVMMIPEGADPADPKAVEFTRTTNAGAVEVVSQLLRRGVPPESIEIWTGCRKPKVKIAFE